MSYKLTYPWQPAPESFSTLEKAIKMGQTVLWEAERACREYDTRDIVISKDGVKVGHFNLFGDFKET